MDETIAPRGKFGPYGGRFVPEALQTLAGLEGILPALEPAHAVFTAMQRARDLDSEQAIVVTLSGRGDKDVQTVADAMGVSL